MEEENSLERLNEKMKESRQSTSIVRVQLTRGG